MIPDFKTYIGESIWRNISQRSEGIKSRKEDYIENLNDKEMFEYIKQTYEPTDKTKTEYLFEYMRGMIPSQDQSVIRIGATLIPSKYPKHDPHYGWIFFKYDNDKNAFICMKVGDMLARTIKDKEYYDKNKYNAYLSYVLEDMVIEHKDKTPLKNIEVIHMLDRVLSFIDNPLIKKIKNDT